MVGIVAAVGAFMIAGTGDHGRGRAAVVLVAAMIASITLGQLAIDLLFDAEDREAGLGSLVVSSVIISAIPVTLGTVLGYAFGSDRRPA